MSDLVCAVCGERWDAFGVRKDGTGDMAAWEAKLFLKGAGCPGCCGVATGTKDYFKNFGASLLLSGIDDFEQQDAIFDGGLEGERVEWKRPADEVLHTCDWCQNSATVDQDDGTIKFEDECFADRELCDEHFVDVGEHHYCLDCYVECRTVSCTTKILDETRKDPRAIPDDESEQLQPYGKPGEYVRAAYCKECYEGFCDEACSEAIRDAVRAQLRDDVELTDAQLDALFHEEFFDEVQGHRNSDGTANWPKEDGVIEVLKKFHWDKETQDKAEQRFYDGYAQCASLLVHYLDGTALDLRLLAEQAVQEAEVDFDVRRSTLRDVVLGGKL